MEAYRGLIWDLLADLARHRDTHITASLCALHISVYIAAAFACKETLAAYALAREQSLAPGCSAQQKI